MYQALRTSRTEFVPIRHLRYHVRQWGEPSSALPPLVLLHGWMDVSASFQFMVDALSAPFFQGRRILAPDWRGFGLTTAAGTDHHSFPDYLADLDFLLDHYAPGQPVDLVGHSMGGNVAMLYAGVRPQRIRRLINLEGFGMPATRPAQAPGRYARWLDDLKALQRGELALTRYPDQAGVARRLMKTNPRLDAGKADWLASHWARPDETGQWAILGEAAHKVSSAQLYRLDEVLQVFQRITAPTLAVEASDDSLAQWHKGQYTLADYHARLASVPQVERAVIDDAGHMLHHDQPLQLAQRVEKFLT